MKRRRRRSRRKPMKIVQWFKSLSMPKKVWLIAGIVAFLIMMAMVIYVAVVFNKLDRQEIEKDEIIINDLDDDVGVGYTNFVLFGGDSRTGDVSKDLNTDSIIVINLNNETKEVKLVSVYRDTILDLTNGKIKKCNSAYSAGGAKQAINMLNMNLDLDIQHYVTVDFGAVSELVDMLGGIEIDVSEKEWKEVNKYIDETGQVAGKKAVHLTHAGLQTLDGVQATTYARIRKNVGNDFARTERQRLIIQKVVEKAIKSDLATINKIVNELFPRISTNFTLTEVLSYAKSFTKYKITETTGFPFDKGTGTIPGKGSCVYPVTLKTNVAKLHEFLYGTTDYQPSDKVVSISAEIAEIVGSRKADPSTTTNNNSSNTGSNNNTNTGNNDNSNTGSNDNSDTGNNNNTDNENNEKPDTGNNDNTDTGNNEKPDTGTGGEGTGGNGTGTGSGNEGTGTGTGTGGGGTGSGEGTTGGSGTGSETGSGTSGEGTLGGQETE